MAEPKADEPPVSVEQCDRDAAAAEAQRNGDGGFAHSIASGCYDNDPLVQAFARHRIASTPSPTDLPRAASEAMVEAALYGALGYEWEQSHKDAFLVGWNAALSGPAGGDGERDVWTCPPRTDFSTADGTKPDLTCSWCKNRVPITHYGLCNECLDELPRLSPDRFAEGLEAAAIYEQCAKVAEAHSNMQCGPYTREVTTAIAAAIRNLTKDEGEG